METVDKGIRIGNWIIDTLVLLVLLTLVMYLVALFYPDILEAENKTIDFLIVFVIFAYYFLFEAFSGRTIGKLVSKTKVVDKYGAQPRKWIILIRTIVRLTPIYGLSLLFGPIGLHDMLSNTKVVRIKKAAV